MPMGWRRAGWAVLSWWLASSAAAPAAAAQEAAAIVPREYVALPAVGQYGRLPLHRDAVEAQLVAGAWEMPADGAAIESLDGNAERWQALEASGEGQLEAPTLRGGWAATTFSSPDERVMMLEATGHATVYVNGKPRAGDPYGLGWLRVPVLMRAGKNTLLFHLAGETLTARLVAPEGGALISEADHTLPTLVEGEKGDVWGAAPIVNATTEWLDGAVLECGTHGTEPRRTPVAPLAPLSVRKVPFAIPAGSDDDSPTVRYALRLLRAGDAAAENGQRESALALDEVELVLNRVGPAEIQVRTFVSEIDGSVQPYAVRPTAVRPMGDAGSSGEADKKPAIIVALHAAGVSCEEHVARFAAKPWAHVVAPQGRRPFGFDWQTWGRIDVGEALADAQKHYPSAGRRIYLTGHSMGGHGAWHLGVTRPGDFAAIGPSAGWASFWSYGGGMPSFENPSDIESLLLRGYSASDTLALLGNLRATGVYLLHGAADETVPVEQARYLRARLAEFHPNFAYYERPDAGHDWGDECCDWPPMIDFFAHQESPAAGAPQVVDFTTANPAVSHRCFWARIEAQEEQLRASHVAIRHDVAARAFAGSTSNVARLTLDVAHLPPGQPIDVTLDGQAMSWLPWPVESRTLCFERAGQSWSPVEPPSSQFKGPGRNGTFSAVVDHRPLLVYGTAGTEEENQWAAAKARFDAETFWYRGNGALEVLPDTRFDLNRETDRSVILYGNADTNRAWARLLATSPVEVKRGEVRAGPRREAGDDLAVILVRPRAGSDVAMVGAVAGTGPAGMRLTDRLRWHVSGIVYPDLMILGPEVLTEGTADVRAWGYFGNDWQLESGEIAWRKTP
jgi:predicted esterase